VPVKGNDLPNNIRFVPWVDTNAMLSVSSMVIFHGGYTRMEIIRAGLPSIIIPFHSEQEYYGRMLARAGIARLVLGSEGPYQHVAMSWKGGRRWWQGKRDLVSMVAEQSLFHHRFCKP
jgi:UDP-N-acetylglucosamine:LPS N-acetylglucosamine transferase